MVTCRKAFFLSVTSGQRICPCCVITYWERLCCLSMFIYYSVSWISVQWVEKCPAKSLSKCFPAKKPRNTEPEHENQLSVVTCGNAIPLYVKLGHWNLPMLCAYLLGEMVHVTCAYVPTVLCSELLLIWPKEVQQILSPNIAKNKKPRKTESVSETGYQWLFTERQSLSVWT